MGQDREVCLMRLDNRKEVVSLYCGRSLYSRNSFDGYMLELINTQKQFDFETYGVFSCELLDISRFIIFKRGKEPVIIESHSGTDVKRQGNFLLYDHEVFENVRTIIPMDLYQDNQEGGFLAMPIGYLWVKLRDVCRTEYLGQVRSLLASGTKDNFLLLCGMFELWNIPSTLDIDNFFKE